MDVVGSARLWQPYRLYRRHVIRGWCHPLAGDKMKDHFTRPQKRPGDVEGLAASHKATARAKLKFSR